MTQQSEHKYLKISATAGTEPVNFKYMVLPEPDGRLVFRFALQKLFEITNPVTDIAQIFLLGENRLVQGKTTAAQTFSSYPLKFIAPTNLVAKPCSCYWLVSVCDAYICINAIVHC
jgi:hypothetical protein